MKLKVFSSFLLSFAIVAFSVGDVFAEISQTTLDSVSQNCSSIKLQLQRTQKEDSRLRVHLGSQYETISTNLMQNLNIRLVRNNLSNPNLAEQQIQFASERDRFKEEFTAYSQELDKLIKIDCRNEPQKFYEKLQTVRAKREGVYKTTQRLRTITATHHETVNDFIGDLKNAKN
jgi:predicted  nucleic acid-binding Zn-ribbon protein